MGETNLKSIVNISQCPFTRIVLQNFHCVSFMMKVTLNLIHCDFPISDIPKKHRFTLSDAIVGKPSIGSLSLDVKPKNGAQKIKSTNSLNEQKQKMAHPNNNLKPEDDNIQSDQFHIFSFLQNVKLPSLPLLDNMIIKRPQGPPPPPPPSFSPVPHNSPSTNTVPNQESPHNSPHDALDIFNAGLDNFIQNPATLTQLPRPANGQRFYFLNIK